MQFSFLFWRLLAGHFIGDFPLQTNTIFMIKVKYRWGVILHSSIASILIFIFAVPYLPHYPILWLYLFLNLGFHILVDKVKLLITPKVKKLGFLFFLLDQILHIGACWLISSSVPSLPSYGDSLALYGNTNLMIFISVYIAVTFGVLYFIISIKSTFNLPVTFPDWKMKIIEFVERAAITTFTVLGSFYFLLIPLALFPRGFLSFLKKKKYQVSPFDILLALLFSLIAGFILKIVLAAGSKI
ncbi:MAG: DUF3307 domain-containing protein [Candidatus Cloacimonadota bacterium]|nr:MAG: DUF3307 domain-containing protein [Candidatus Cloacimonadota bacterium]